MSDPAPPKRLLLLRHSKSEHTFGVDDYSRQLTERGWRDGTEIGSWLAKQKIMADLVLCSTSTRTRQTWEAAVGGGARAARLTLRKELYQGGISGVLDAVQTEGGDYATIIVVGHSPSMPMLASRLADGAGSPDALARLDQGFPTSGLAVLTYAGEWADIGPGTASLADFVVGRG
ncbi:MAG: histidine phosphatase family protein [Candidatus Phosphoribacter sp.]